MQSEVQLSQKTIERLEEQSGLLLRTYLAEIAKDPTSRATEAARSNLIALKHSIIQIYGESVGVDVASALGFAYVCGEGNLR